MWLRQKRRRYKMRRIIVATALFAILSIATSGCGATTQKSTDFGSENSQKGFNPKGSLTASDTSRLSNKAIKLMIIDSGQYNTEDVNKKLEKIVNSGKYNIIKVNTIYNDSGSLIQAEIYYLVNNSSK